MRKIGLISLALAASLLPSTMFAGRLDGSFSTQEQDAAVDTNDACIITQGGFFAAGGVVTGVANGCTVQILYTAPEAHKASSTALKGTKTNGSSKVSQTIFTNAVITITDSDGAGAGVCAVATVAVPVIMSVQSDVEKCKVSASMKGTAVDPGADTVESSSVSTSCEFGEAGVDLVVTSPVGQNPTTPTQPQIDAVVDAFADRNDVKFANDGKLSIKHKGVPNTAVDICGQVQPS